MTQRLYYDDSYLRRFEARVLSPSPDRRLVYLDRTAFYPTSGGQPHDLGTLASQPVLDVSDEDGRIAHQLETPLPEGAESVPVAGVLDWTRRFDHMQQHTGQHLLSAVFLRELGAETVSFHLGAESSTIDLAAPMPTGASLARVEHAANAVVFENRPVAVSYADSSEPLNLRKPSARAGAIRIVEIDSLDRSACGGTHVRATGEIGPILFRKLEKIRNNVRVEFLCGFRALEAARRDFDELSSVARFFSVPREPVLVLAEAQRARLEDAEKTRRRLAAELAALQGLRAYDETSPNASGLRLRVVRLDSLTDEVRAEAQSFTSRPASCFLALGSRPPAVLFAVSADASPAGPRLQSVLSSLGGRGGGSPRLAQGSLPNESLLAEAERLLLP